MRKMFVSSRLGLSARSWKRFSSTTVSFHLPESRKSREAPKIKDLNYPLLYKGSQAFNIRLMTGLGFFNAGYWSFSLATLPTWTTSFTIGSDLFTLAQMHPLWIGLGFLGTGCIFYFTKAFSDRAIYSVYENTVTNRLGFQMHTIFGYPGRLIEVYPINVKFGKENLRTSLMPLIVKDLDIIILLDKDGIYYDNGRLVTILQSSTNIILGISSAITDKHNPLIKNAKEERVKLMKEKYRQQRIK